MENQIRATGYLRVSTSEQAINGVSLDAQEEKIRAYCVAKDFNLIGVIRDEGFSGKNLQRPGVQRLITNCTRKECDVVIVFKLDRLARSVKQFAHMLEDVFEKNHVAFTSIQDNFDTSTANGRMVMNIVSSLAQWESDIISERTKHSMQYMKRNLKLIGAVPYGFDLIKGDLQPDPEELKTVQLMASLRQKGKSYQTIAATLNTKKIPSKTGKTWFPKTVMGVLKSFQTLPREPLYMKAFGSKGFPKLPRDVRDMKKKGAR